MKSCDAIILEKINEEIRLSLAKMTLEMIESLRERHIQEINPAIVREIRENAQAMNILLR